jgi:ABC-type nitrate/sulfonate/bicarbonate transport system substrate-binding protein
MLALNNYSNMFAAMKIDKIGTLAGSPPNGNQAESQGIGKILFSGDEFEELAKYPYLVGSANTRELAQSPDKYKALVAGMADAMKLLRDNPEAGKPCLRKEFADLDQKTFDAAYDYTVAGVPDSPLITPEVFEALSDFADASDQPLGVDYDKAVAADIVKDAIG